MTEQLKHASSGVQERTQDFAKNTPVSGVQENVQGATDTALSYVDSFSSQIFAKGQSIVDSIFPPENRAAFLAKLQDFMLRNPKLSAFLGMNLALTGVPLGLFILFSLSVFIFALVVALIVGLLAAVLFTLFMVGLALLVVLPTVMFTTGAACFLFLWGLGGYYILKWANGDFQGKDGKSNQAPEGQSIGDHINRLTGGRMDGFMEEARQQNAKKGIEIYHDRSTNPVNSEKQNGSTGHPTGTDAAANAQNKVGEMSSKTITVTSDVQGSTTNAAKPLAYAKGGLKGTTGLGI